MAGRSCLLASGSRGLCRNRGFAGRRRGCEGSFPVPGVLRKHSPAQAWAGGRALHRQAWKRPGRAPRACRAPPQRLRDSVPKAAASRTRGQLAAVGSQGSVCLQLRAWGAGGPGVGVSSEGAGAPSPGTLFVGTRQPPAGLCGPVLAPLPRPGVGVGRKEAPSVPGWCGDF